MQSKKVHFSEKEKFFFFIKQDAPVQIKKSIQKLFKMEKTAKHPVYRKTPKLK